jgi:putative PIN family toxin of toxin-antitoxin system
MLDTNVLISAFVFGGKSGKLLRLLLDSEHELYVSDYIDQEFKAKLEIKWPDKASAVYRLYHRLNIHFCESTDEKLGELRDEKDIPVLSDAMYHKVDLIVSGDKDFLEANLDYPLIFSPAMLLAYLEEKKVHN